MDLPQNHRVEINVRAIANGFLMSEELAGEVDGSYRSKSTVLTYFRTLEDVEQSLAARFRSALGLELTPSDADMAF